MSWNYRIIKREQLGEVSLQLHEVYYDKKGDMNSWSINPIAPCGETVIELGDDLARMQEALIKPVLIENNNELEESTNE